MRFRMVYVKDKKGGFIMRDKGRMRFGFDSCRQLCDQKTYKTVKHYGLRSNGWSRHRYHVDGYNNFNSFSFFGIMKIEFGTRTAKMDLQGPVENI